ncbi:family 16 glycosylhydrolase [Granulosicoccus sp. 3-233]|uniref:family 16 glycosylhydrolase n=1 Tax=Granulosicoccus sp. 3-233 TaxID=3417969 RepID=UPI003D325EFB
MRIPSLALALLGALSTFAHADNQRPSTVSNVQAGAVSTTAIRLTWNTPWDNVGVDGFNIYRNGDYYNTIFNATNFIDTNLSPGTRYEYSVVAFDKARNYSTLSLPSAATTSSTGSNTSLATGAAPPASARETGNGTPAAPANLRAEVQGSDSVRLEWSAPGGSVSGYNLYRDGRYHKTVRGRTDYVDSALSPGREYRWRVVAFLGQRFSLKSNEVRASTESESAVVAVAATAAEAHSGVPAGYQLVFNDEFRGNKLDDSKWSSRYRWGPSHTINNELQYYVDSQSDSGFGYSPFTFDGENLIISAIRTPSHLKSKANNKSYLSGAMTTYGKFRMRYGYVEMRARLPRGQGLWPAFWLLHNHDNGIRPEIDVVEMLGDQPAVVYQTYHHYNNRNLRSTPSHEVWGTDFSAGFHTYGMRWEPGRITWYVDGEARNAYANNNVSAEDMYLLVNLAIGGAWAGSPDANTPFPARLTIDYIRAYSGD